MNIDDFVRLIQCEELEAALGLDAPNPVNDVPKPRRPRFTSEESRQRNREYMREYSRWYYHEHIDDMRRKGREKSKRLSERRAWMKEHDPEAYEALLAKGREYQRKRYQEKKAATA